MLINLAIAICLRFFLSFLPGISFDMGAWFGWADRLVSLSWGSFYSKEVWTHYTPGYFYVLYLLRRIELLLKNLFLVEPSGIWEEVLFKLPANLADIGIGILIYKILKEKSRKIAILASAFYLFNPAIIFNSSVWGQADSVMAFLMLLAVYLLLNKKTIFASFSYALAFLVKPQALFLAPFFLLLLIKKKRRREGLNFGLIFLIAVLILSLPFFPNDPFFGIWKMINQMGRDYPYTTLNALNFWYLFGNWQSDQALILAIPKHLWGIGIFLLFELLIVLKVFLKKNFLKKKDNTFLFTSLLLLNFYLFPTRIHERYLFPFFPFFVIAVFSSRFLKLRLVYVLLSLIHLANLYYVYCFYQPNFLKVNFLFNLISFLNPVFSLLTIIIFGYLLYLFWQGDIPRIKVNQKKIKRFFSQNRLIILILFFSFLVRFWHLDYPPKFYFDEVYHAFTATEMAKGNVKAWEWWNTPPEGMAYEWTHPPMAKLFMTTGILLFGETAFAWRFFGALLGVGSVFLVYLIGKKLFNQKIALFASFLFAFDGLPLVMSRIGMNDSYFLFFTLLTLWLFLEEGYLFASIAFGLALSSKWTALYLLPVLGGWWLYKFFQQKKKKRFNWLKHFIIHYSLFIIFLPIGIYLFSYLPFFVSGHTFSQWWHLQHQMWWYHTGLTATHPYQSSALSWMIMKRPVWFFVDYAQDSIANIYAMGNPLIWWGGLISLPFVIWQTLKTRNHQLRLIIFAYFAFFMPWVVSPRIMFIYHYLPSIPFLCLFLGWTLAEFWKGKLEIGNWKLEIKPWIVGYLALVGLVFIFFYPHLTGLHVPQWLNKLYYWFSSWK